MNIRKFTSILLVIVYSFIAHACYSSDSSVALEKLNKIITTSSINKVALGIESEYVIKNKGKDYKLYLVTTNDFYGNPKCCIGVAVDSNNKKAIELPGGAVEVKVIDINNDGSSEIVKDQLSFSHGYTKVNKEIYKIQNEKFKLLHQFEGSNNEGQYDKNDKNFKSIDAEFSFVDINNDGKKELVEKIINIDSGIKSEIIKNYSFNGTEIIEIE